MGMFDNVVFEHEFVLVAHDCRDVPWQTKDIMHFEDRYYDSCDFKIGADGRLRRTATKGWPGTCSYSGPLDLVWGGPLEFRLEEITLQVRNGVVVQGPQDSTA